MKFSGEQQIRKLCKKRENLIAKLQRIGANMSIKVNFLFSHLLDRFQAIMRSVSDEQGDRFHQHIEEIETTHQGRWDKAMMADNCWSLERRNPAASYFRAAKKRKFLP